MEYKRPDMAPETLLEKVTLEALSALALGPPDHIGDIAPLEAVLPLIAKAWGLLEETLAEKTKRLERGKKLAAENKGGVPGEPLLECYDGVMIADLLCWIAEDMLKKRMWVDTNDYGALHACAQNDAVEVCKLLLDGGMNFDQYRQWTETRPCVGHEETLQALADHWTELKAAQEQGDQAPQQTGGMTLG